MLSNYIKTEVMVLNQSIPEILDEIREKIGSKTAQNNPFGSGFNKERAEEISEGFWDGNVDEEDWIDFESIGDTVEGWFGY